MLFSLLIVNYLLELLSREVRKMSSTIEEYKDEYNRVTYEILDYIDNLRK